MKKHISPAIMAATLSLLFSTPLFSEDEDFSIRFRSGRIIAAELIPGDSTATQIRNVNPHEPTSRISTDVAYAGLVVTLDPGRSVSIYDYELKDANGLSFPCVAVKEKDGVFDASKWLYENAPQTNRYTLLFRVQLPPPNKPFRYDLVFNLLKGSEPVSVPFVRLKDKSLTNPALFPETGIALASAEQIRDFYAKIYNTAPDKPEEKKQ